MQRRKFLETSAFLSTLISAGCASAKNNHGKSSRALELKGQTNPAIKHWDVVTIGNLSRNRYWGESEEKSLHAVICTTTIITGENFHVIVDPSLKDPVAMADELKRRTGLTPDDINVAFITHEHGDHHAGLPNFPKAQWLANPLAAEVINKNEKYVKRVEPAGNKIYDVIDVVPAPGHTPGTSGLRFDYRGLSVFVAGDSVATKDFWDEGRMYFKALDMEMSKHTMQKIAAISNIVVPGHDNYFLCL